MSASVFQSLGLTRTEDASEVRSEERRPSPAGGWSQNSFAREQIQGLVRKVFFANAMRPVRQVVFSAIEPETDVRSICRRVGDALALETPGTVAVMGGCPRLLKNAETQPEVEERLRPGTIPPLRRISTRVNGNLWLVPALGRIGNAATTASLHSYLGELRREFEYSIVEGPAAGESTEATALAQFADGIILVLSAHHTRRVTACRVKDALEVAQARVLGTVLCDRVFPIPEGIYRRL